MNSLLLQEFMLNIRVYHDTQPPLWPLFQKITVTVTWRQAASGDFGLKDVMSQEKINGTQPQAEKMMSLL